MDASVITQGGGRTDVRDEEGKLQLLMMTMARLGLFAEPAQTQEQLATL